MLLIRVARKVKVGVTDSPNRTPMKDSSEAWMLRSWQSSFSMKTIVSALSSTPKKDSITTDSKACLSVVQIGRLVSLTQSFRSHVKFGKRF